MTTTVSTAAASIKEHGICVVQAPELGEKVFESVDKGYNLWSTEGLNIVRQSTFDNELIRDIIESLIPESVLCLYHVVGPNDTLVYKASVKEDEVVIFVHVFSKDSNAVFYKGSHLIKEEVQRRDLLEVMGHPQGEPDEVKSGRGVIAVTDARISFRMRSGYSVALSFAPKPIIEREGWPQMEVPIGFKPEVEAMQKPSLKTDFTYLTPEQVMYRANMNKAIADSL